MSEGAAAAVQTEPVIQYVQDWSDSFSQVMGEIAGSAIPGAVLTETPAELIASGEGDCWVLCMCSGGLRGELSLRLDPRSAQRAAQGFTGETAAPDSSVTVQHREAVLELLRQVAGNVATSLNERWGEVQVHVDLATGPASWPASSTFWIQSGTEASASMLLELHLSAALVAALRTVQSPARKPNEVAATAAPLQPGETNLDLLREVELAVTLRFGGRQLLLREVLDLCLGAVIELDRRVQEPVDVLLDGRLVAKGEIVVIDGNFGLRVTQVSTSGAI